MSGRCGLWWGTVEGAGFEEIVDAAASSGFTHVSITPAMFFASLSAGRSEHDLRAIVDGHGVSVAVIDPLIRGLPGSIEPDAAGRRFRSTFEHDEWDCYRAAEALGATSVNIAHFLGAPTPVEVLAEAIGGIAERASTRGIDVVVEFMPEGSIGDLATAAAIIAAVDAPNCGLMLDTWHHWRCSGDVEEIRRLPPGSVRVAQLSDALVDVRGSGAAPPTRHRLFPGEGTMPLVAMVAAIRENNPEVLLGVEVFSARPGKLAPGRRARIAKESLDRLAGAATGPD